MNEDLIKVDLELRSLSEKVKSGEIKTDEAKTKLEELKVQKRDIEQRIAQANAPKDEEKRNTILADAQKAMVEKRAITLNGTGLINQVKELFKELSKKKEILGLIREFIGPNAQTNIPVWSPTLAVPGTVSEGATGISLDTQAAMGNKSITPKAYVSILSVSAESLALGSVNLEAELPAIFADAFADAFAKGVIQGDGTFNGLFQGITQTVTGGKTVAGLAKLALELRDYTDEAIIILNPQVYSEILGDTASNNYHVYQEELIRNKTIEGVKVILTTYAPTAGTFAVGGKMSNYGIGLASEVRIQPKFIVGDTSTYYEATMFAGGTKIVDKNFWGLIA